MQTFNEEILIIIMQFPIRRNSDPSSESGSDDIHIHHLDMGEDQSSSVSRSSSESCHSQNSNGIECKFSLCLTFSKQKSFCEEKLQPILITINPYGITFNHKSLRDDITGGRNLHF